MTTPYPHDERAPHRQQRTIWLINLESSMAIPPYGACEVRGTTISSATNDVNEVLYVRRPTLDGMENVVFNGPSEIAANKRGVGTCDYPCWSIVNPQGNSVPGTMLGTTKDSFGLQLGRPGFMCFNVQYYNPGGVSGTYYQRIIPWQRLVRVKATASIAPGAVSGAGLMQYGPDPWADTGSSITIVDPLKILFALSGEKFIVEPVDYQASGIRFQPVHPFGLRRKGKTDGVITVGGSNTVSIWAAGADSGINVTAHLNWMATVDLAANKECIVEYFADEDKWVVTNAAC